MGDEKGDWRLMNSIPILWEIWVCENGLTKTTVTQSEWRPAVHACDGLNWQKGINMLILAAQCGEEGDEDGLCAATMRRGRRGMQGDIGY